MITIIMTKSPIPGAISELTKFKKDKPRYLCTPFEKWLHILKFGDIYIRGRELPEVLRKEEGVEDAVSKARYANASKRIRHMIDAQDMARRDNLGRLYNAREEGKIEGKLEDKIEVSMKMLEKGYDIDTIAEITGLSKEEIEKLK